MAILLHVIILGLYFVTVIAKYKRTLILVKILNLLLPNRLCNKE